mgnify:CR=1 FL=1
MRKILFILAAAAMLLGINSCKGMLDRTGDYTIAFETQGYVESEEDEQALKDYFEANFLSEQDYVTFYGSYADAVNKALEFFDTHRTKADGEFILSHINSKEDIVYLICVLTGNQTREAIASTYWDYALKESLGLVTE